MNQEQKILNHLDSKMGEEVWWRFEGEDKYRPGTVKKISLEEKKVRLFSTGQDYTMWIPVNMIEVAGIV